MAARATLNEHAFTFEVCNSRCRRRVDVLPWQGIHALHIISSSAIDDRHTWKLSLSPHVRTGIVPNSTAQKLESWTGVKRLAGVTRPSYQIIDGGHARFVIHHQASFQPWLLEAFNWKMARPTMGISGTRNTVQSLFSHCVQQTGLSATMGGGERNDGVMSSAAPEQITIVLCRGIEEIGKAHDIACR